MSKEPSQNSITLIRKRLKDDQENFSAADTVPAYDYFCSINPNDSTELFIEDEFDEDPTALATVIAVDGTDVDIFIYDAETSQEDIDNVQLIADICNDGESVYEGCLLKKTAQGFKFIMSDSNDAVDFNQFRLTDDNASHSDKKVKTKNELSYPLPVIVAVQPSTVQSSTMLPPQREYMERDKDGFRPPYPQAPRLPTR